ncbi:hypothetical protein [Streptomyces sp. NPDC002550]
MPRHGHARDVHEPDYSATRVPLGLALVTDATWTFLHTTFLQTNRISYDAIAKDYAARCPADGRHPLGRTVITAFDQLVAEHGAAPWPTWAAAPHTSPHCCTSWASRPSAWTSPPPW